MRNICEVWNIILTITLWCITATQGSPVSEIVSLASLTSQEMSSYMDLSVDPCEDFYTFACGNWAKIHPATETEVETNNFQLSVQQWRNYTLKFLSHQRYDDTETERKVKYFYESCLNITQGDEYNNKLRQLLEEFGQMPALAANKWQDKDFDWQKLVSEIKYNYDLNIILNFDIHMDPEQIKIYRLGVRQAKFKNKSFYENEAQRQKYEKEMAKNMKNYLSLSEDLAKKTSEELVNLEAMLVGNFTSDALVQSYYYELSLDQLHNKYTPNLDIKSMVKTCLGSYPRGYVLEYDSKYLENLGEIIKAFPKRIVANYIFYKLLESFVPPSFSRKDNEEDRQRKCHGQTKKYFANVLDNMVYKKSDFQMAEEDVRSIFLDLQAFYEGALASETYYSWLEKTTRKLAVEKLRAMKIKFNTYKEVDFAQDYGTLVMDPQDYVTNLKFIYSAKAAKHRAKLNGPVKPYYDSLKMSFTPQYVFAENIIRIPLPIIYTSLFWHEDLPFAYNFARMGYLIGHEIIHAFDEVGRQVDIQGKVQDLWDAHSVANFANRTQCFIEQTQRFSYEGQPLAKRSKQSETIADNGGIRLAYETYRTWFESALLPQIDRDKEMLPALVYKDKQLFFLSYAQTLCSDMVKATRDMMILTDPHLPTSLRVKSSLLNYEEFANAFMCPKGSGMNPEEKCRMY
ncbi:neprilysin-4 [Stomoxys calcitrans]|uniref:neprilysin-4 n=1 Tax=Stomoxys calcitrans TaxID=35570 RepID=UPI0027E331AA|nr:neprilysin-4 [Stomoxys calcitrans]